MDRGTASIGSLLSYIIFNILPVFVDITVAVVYFIFVFDWLFGMVVFSTMALYILFTIWITEWRTQFRRDMIELDNEVRSTAVDSLLNFETVKYYNNESFEVNRFNEAILKYQDADWKSSASLNVLNTAQNATITIGLLVGCLLCAYKVMEGKMTVGEFVLFMTYMYTKNTSDI
jgi:ATP-binding cassette subfamily B (MDR/TAP) protein 6